MPEDRYDDAVEALRAVQAPHRWDDVASRSAQPSDDGVAIGLQHGVPRRRGRVLVAALALTGAITIGLAVRDDGRQPVSSNGTAATTATAPAITHEGGCAFWLAYSPGIEFATVPTSDGTTLLRGTVGAQQVEVGVPGRPRLDLPGDRTETLTVRDRASTLWPRDDGSVHVFVPGGGEAPCESFEVVVQGGAAEANADLAIRVADGLLLVGGESEAERRRAAEAAAEAATQAAAGRGCASLHLTSSSLPPGFSASLAADGTFEGDGQSIEVVPATPTGAAGTTIGPWLVGLRVDLEAPAFEVQVLDDCSLVLIGRGGVTQAQLQDLLAAAYLVDGERRPVLADQCAVSPETAQVGVPREPPVGRDDALATAVTFGRDVLGWADAEAVDGEDTHDGTDELALTLRRSDEPDVSIGLRLARCLGGRWWSVSYVGARPTTEEASASVSINGTTAFAAAGPLPSGTVSSTVRFDYGGRVAEGPAGEDFELGFIPDSTGSVLVLFRDAAGAVIGAWGTTLPSGDFAAG